MNQIARESLLYDCYGALLTAKKRRVMELYHEEDLTLAEIAEEAGISRAAVHDSLKSAERKLEEYESKLGMVRRLMDQQKAHSDIEHILSEMEAENALGEMDRKRIAKIREIIGELVTE